MKLVVAVLALLLLLTGIVTTRAQTISTPISPAPVTGYGTLSVLAASLALSTATVGPNSPAFPAASLPNRYIEVKNAPGSANVLFVCILGGTCATTTGIPLAVGEAKSWFVPSANGQFTAPTVISGGTATAIVSW